MGMRRALQRPGEIADAPVGVTGDHEGGIQGVVAEPSSRLPGDATAGRVKSVACQPMASSSARLVILSPSWGAEVDPFGPLISARW